MPGNPASPNPCQQKPYVVHRIGKDALDIEGKLINPSSEFAHIPVEKFKFKNIEKGI